MGKVKRKITIIKERLQYRMITVLVILSILVSLLTFGFARYLLFKSPGASMAVPQAAMIQVQALLVGLIGGVLFSMIVGVWMSHKIAGPLFRFEKTFRMLKEGDFSDRICLRKGDMLEETAEEINNALESLRGSAKIFHDTSKRLHDHIEELSARDGGRLEGELAEARKISAELMDFFVIEKDEVPSPEPEKV